MRYLSVLIVCLALIFTTVKPEESRAQALNLFAGNTLFGAATGAAIGGASMALANDADLRPLQMGVGFGTIGGVALGAYDVATLSSGMRVNGLIHSAPMSGTIIFLDTIYGAATGGMLGMAVSLIGDTNIVKGLQYGAGVGAYAGLAFGLVDAFYFGSVGGEYYDYSFAPTSSSGGGILTLYESTSSSFTGISPTVYKQSVLTPGGSVAVTHQSFGLEVLRFSGSF